MSPPDLSTNPEVRELTAQTETLLAVGSNYTVANAAEYGVAGTELKRVKDAQKRLEALRKSMTQPLDTAKKAILEFFRAPEDKLARAESGIKRAMISFQDEQERLRREEQRRADEIARQERVRQEQAAAETRRKAEEEAAKLRREAEAAAAAGRASEAAKLSQRADAKIERAESKAEGIEQRAASVVAPVIQRTPPKVAGVDTREVVKFEITDPLLVPREYLAVDEVKIGKVVRALKMETKIAGVRVWTEKSIAAGAA